MDNLKKSHPRPIERHHINRIGWVRAAVLGANDGILSTASIVSGVALGGAPHPLIILTGIASLIAGASSMATGEYVSVSSQSDIERSDLLREASEIHTNRSFEQEELAQIYVGRGVDITLARQVADQMMKHDALGAHARDELGISDTTTAKPLQAALSSAISFSAGSVLPLIAAIASPLRFVAWTVPLSSLLALGVLGALSAKTGGVRMTIPIMRIFLWGAFSIGITSFVGHFFSSAG